MSWQYRKRFAILLLLISAPKTWKTDATIKPLPQPRMPLSSDTSKTDNVTLKTAPGDGGVGNEGLPEAMRKLCHLRGAFRFSCASWRLPPLSLPPFKSRLDWGLVLKLTENGCSHVTCIYYIYVGYTQWNLHGFSGFPFQGFVTLISNCDTYFPKHSLFWMQRV